MTATPMPPRKPTKTTVRKQIDAVPQQISDSRCGQRGHETGSAVDEGRSEAPVSALVTVAAVAAGLAFVVTGLGAATPRSRYDRTLDEMRDLYDRLRGRF